MARRYQDLIVWQKAMDVVTSVYRVTDSFPREELYGLTAQIRRAAVSIPANIAEGAGRVGKNEYARFVAIARLSTGTADSTRDRGVTRNDECSGTYRRSRDARRGLCDADGVGTTFGSVS